MFEDFEVSHLFKGQVHEHPHFSLNIQGHEYKGMVQDDKIHWYNPHPKQRFEEEHVNAIESKVQDLMSDHLQ
ncbi:hypothetical protein R4Z09_15420 [Niallia oryzisoli]|uniref:Uncharacterized protein n=1 Tax=Niallia oryzisoli TaxID=1737571 RepID=A0ABZ2CQP9_9BACI